MYKKSSKFSQRQTGSRIRNLSLPAKNKSNKNYCSGITKAGTTCKCFFKGITAKDWVNTGSKWYCPHHVIK